MNSNSIVGSNSRVPSAFRVFLAELIQDTRCLPCCQLVSRTTHSNMGQRLCNDLTFGSQLLRFSSPEMHISIEFYNAGGCATDNVRDGSITRNPDEARLDDVPPGHFLHTRQK